MRILYVVHGFPPRAFTGTESYTYQTARMIAKNNETGAFYIFKDPQQAIFSREEKEQDGIKCWGINYDVCSQARNFPQTWHTPQVAQAFRDCLEDFKPDVVHFTYILSGLSIEQIADAKKSGAKVVITLTDFLPLCLRGQLLDPNNELCTGPESSSKCAHCVWMIKRIHNGILEAIRTKIWPVAAILRKITAAVISIRRRKIIRAITLADCVITPTAALATQYKRWMPEIKNTESLGFGIDAKLFDNFHREAGEKIRFGFIGQLLPHKGAHVLLDAAQKLPQEKCDIIIFGGTNQPGSAEYVAGLKEKHRGDNIHWRGTFPHEKIAEAFAQFDILVVPSLWHENSPLVVLYAKQSHTPMIASDYGGLTEFVDDGVTGFVFAPDDAEALAATMRKFIEETDLAKNMAEKITAPMNTEQHAQRLMEIYGAIAE